MIRTFAPGSKPKGASGAQRMHELHAKTGPMELEKAGQAASIRGRLLGGAASAKQF
jgi:hypothetical protein